LFLFDIEFFTNVDTFLDIVVDAPLNFGLKLILVSQLLEGFEVLAFLKVLSADVTDECSNPIDVVGQTNNTDYFNEDEAHCFIVSCCVDVPEAHCQHYIHSPIVGPNVLLKPKGVGTNVFAGIPIVVHVDVGDSSEKYGENMRKAEVKQKHFC
jgi:hypothetical protein